MKVVAMNIEKRIETIEKAIRQKTDIEQIEAETLGISVSELREIRAFVKNLSDEELVEIIEQN